jgi:hypothetical protein
MNPISISVPPTAFFSASESARARRGRQRSSDDTFKQLILTLIALPLVLVIGSSRAKAIPGPAEVQALD